MENSLINLNRFPFRRQLHAVVMNISHCSYCTKILDCNNTVCLNKENMPISLKLDKHLNNIGYYLLAAGASEGVKYWGGQPEQQIFAKRLTP